MAGIPAGIRWWWHPARGRWSLHGVDRTAEAGGGAVVRVRGRQAVRRQANTHGEPSEARQPDPANECGPRATSRPRPFSHPGRTRCRNPQQQAGAGKQNAAALVLYIWLCLQPTWYNGGIQKMAAACSPGSRWWSRTWQNGSFSSTKRGSGAMPSAEWRRGAGIGRHCRQAAR